MQNIKRILKENPLATCSGNPVRQDSTSTSISKTNQNQVPPVTSSPSKNPEYELQRIETLFLRFSVIYGHVWQSLYNDEPVVALAKKEWRIALRPFDNPIIKAALEYCREYSPFPPTLPGFIENCKAIVKRNKSYTPRVIEGTRISLEAAEAHLQKIRTLLNMPSKSQGEHTC